MMAVVALAAVDCLAIRTADFVAGCWLVGASVQVGLFAMLRSRGWGRRFWAGFEAAGLGLLLAYTAGSHASARVVNGWAHRVSQGLYDFMLGLPDGAFQWCLQHGLVVDPRKPLKVYEVVILFEIAYGLPMLLLAGIAGAVTAWLWSRRAVHRIDPPS